MTMVWQVKFGIGEKAHSLYTRNQRKATRAALALGGFYSASIHRVMYVGDKSRIDALTVEEALNIKYDER